MPAHIRLPAEWEPQSSVLIAWPPQDSDFAPWLDAVETTYTAIATATSRRETVIIACRDPATRARAERRLITMADCRLDRLRWVMLAYDDCWVRDTAPLTVETDHGLLLMDFRFNGWGGKHPHTLDAEFARNLAASGALPWPIQRVDLVLEGGSIESDGMGTLLTTEHCLLNRNRNPQLDRAGIETALREHLGSRRIFWLRHGKVAGDDTDAHVDTLARFCSPDTIAYTACDDPDDSHYRELSAMAAELAEFRTVKGMPYRLIPLPIPRPIEDSKGQRLPATYANFLIINDAVLVPVYDDPQDALALERLRPAFPKHELVPVYCRPLIHQYGSLHCMTMQFPAFAHGESAA